MASILKLTSSRKPQKGGGKVVSGKGGGSPAEPETPPQNMGRPLLIFIGLLVLVSLVGAPYYVLPLSERVRSPMHPWLRPSGYIGQGMGILAFLIFLMLWLYPVRKKYRQLAWTGNMAQWLDAHIAVALAVPLIGAIHAAWRFEGLVGLGYWSMIIVCLSGVAGRYLYMHVPRGSAGLELTAEEMSAERRYLLNQLAAQTGLPVTQVEAVLRSDPFPCEGLGLVGTLRRMLQDDVDRWRATRALRRLCARESPRGRLDRKKLKSILRLASAEMRLTQQARLLEATQRVFRFWHVAHRPFAITAFVALAVHVGVVTYMGMTWFW